PEHDAMGRRAGDKVQCPQAEDRRRLDHRACLHAAGETVVSPVVTWGMRFAASAALGLALPFLPAPVRPFGVVLVLFAAWALAANDAKKDERDAADLPDVPLVQPAARGRARPRRVQAAFA